MANINFKPWLGAGVLSGTDAQQTNYNTISAPFQPGDLIKSTDFNALLRMTTLVCAGVASAFDIDSLTIDTSEDAINKKLKNPTFETLIVNGSVNGYGSITIAGSISADGFSGRNGTVESRVISTKTLTITKNGSIDASDNGSITAQSITANQIKSPATIEASNLKATTTIEAPAGTITKLSSTNIDTSTIKVDTINPNSAGKITVGSTLSANTIESSLVTVGSTNKTIIGPGTVATNSVTTQTTNGGNISGNQLEISGQIDTKTAAIGETISIGNNAAKISKDGTVLANKYTINGSDTQISNYISTGGNIISTSSIQTPYFDARLCKPIFSKTFQKSELANTTVDIGFQAYNADGYDYLYYVVVAFFIWISR